MSGGQVLLTERIMNTRSPFVFSSPLETSL
jgi:hypothetical protein